MIIRNGVFKLRYCMVSHNYCNLHQSDTLISQTREDKTSYYLYDGHGDVRALINEEGRISDKYHYNAYGELLEQRGDTETF